MKRKLPEKFFEQNQRAKTRKWKFFNLNQALWGAGNREFRYEVFSFCSYWFWKTTALQRPVLVSVRPLLAFPTTHNTLIYLAFPLPGARIPNFL